MTKFCMPAHTVPATRVAPATLVALICLWVGMIVALPGIALAQGGDDFDLDALRRDGQIVERFDGLIEARDSNGASSKLRAYIKRVNGERQAIYDQRARENKVEAAQVGRLYAEQIYGDAPSGTYFRTPAGEVVRKP